MELNKESNVVSLSNNVGRQFFISKNNANNRRQNDEELWHAFKEGSLTAFRLMYEQNSDPLIKYGNKITPYHAIVSDTIQDLFADLWNKRSKLAKVNNIRGYLFTCYRRRLLDELKKQKKNLHIKYLNGFEILLSKPIEDWGLEEDEEKSITSALNALPYQQKEAIYLRFFNDLPCSEVGVIMGIKTQSVYNLISSGIKSLRTTLSTVLHF
jgi:RNA polymerase sigma factor (sigma-70 family)